MSKISGYFSAKKDLTLPDPVADLKKQSDSIIRVFSDTVAQLNDVNAKIEQEEQQKSAQVQKLQDDLGQLANLRMNNVILAGNIQDLFKPKKDV